MTGELLPICVGINASPPATPLISMVAGHEVAAIPGGFSVIGSTAFENAPPHWVYVSPFRIGTTVVNCKQYQAIMGMAIKIEAGDCPVVTTCHTSILTYLEGRGGGLVLPYEAQWECAGRGPAVNIRKLMEEEGVPITPDGIATFIDGRFENLVFGVLGLILNDPRDGAFRRLVREGWPFWGWRVYATPSGRLTREDVCFDRSEGDELNANWGPANSYGLKGMTGLVWEVMADRFSANAYLFGGINPTGPENGEYHVIRGGAYNVRDPRILRLGGRSYGYPEDRWDSYAGFRVAAPVLSEVVGPLP